MGHRSGRFCPSTRTGMGSARGTRCIGDPGHRPARRDVRERHHLDHGGGSCSRSGSSGRLRSVSIAIATPSCRSIRATRTSSGRSCYSAAGRFEPSRRGQVLPALRKHGGRRLNRYRTDGAIGGHSSSANKPQGRSAKATPLLLVGLDVLKGCERGSRTPTPYRAPDPMVSRPHCAWCRQCSLS